MQRRKGFTLVELVIVIAVIAILAGVLIGTFASVLNKAQESAKMQEMKAAEHEQKADDLLKKIENSNWYGWEDFEASIVEKMTQAYKANATNGTTITKEEIQKVVKDALAEYAKSNAQSNTALTEEQVKTIIEDAIGKIKYNGVTEAQVRAIVNAATTSIQGSQLSAAQVKSIINTANANNLTAADVSAVIAQLGLAKTTDVNSAVTQITTALTEATGGALTTDDLSAALIDLLPVTYKVTSQADLTKALASVNTFSTLNFTKDFAASIETDANVTLTVVGVKLSNLTVKAPLATIYLVTDEGKVKVESVAEKSLHVSGQVAELEINKGRIVVEENGAVEKLTASPEKNAVITVAVEKKATVAKLTIDLQFNTTGTETCAETVSVENAGNVDDVAVTKTGSGSQSTNVTVDNNIGAQGASAKEIADTAATAKVEVKVTDIAASVDYDVAVSGNTGTVTTTPNVNTTKELVKVAADKFIIRTSEELRLLASLVNSKAEYEEGKLYSAASYQLTADVDLSDRTWEPIGKYKDSAFTGTFDGFGFTIVGMSNYVDYEYDAIPLTSYASGNLNTLYGLFNHVIGGTIQNIKLLNVSVKMPGNENGGGVGGGLVAYANYETHDKTTTISGCEVSGVIDGFDCLGSIVGRANYYGGSITNVTDCVSSANITGHRTKGNYCRIGGIVGYSDTSSDNDPKARQVNITNCSFSGTITGRLEKSGVGSTATSDGLCGSTGSVTITNE